MSTVSLPRYSFACSLRRAKAMGGPIFVCRLRRRTERKHVVRLVRRLGSTADIDCRNETSSGLVVVPIDGTNASSKVSVTK